jgi:hypothetical protein
MNGKNILQIMVTHNDSKQQFVRFKKKKILKKLIRLNLNYFSIQKKLIEFLKICFFIVFESSSLNSHIKSKTYFVKAGSFSSFHLNGDGVNRGASVSTSIFLSGIFFAAS